MLSRFYNSLARKKATGAVDPFTVEFTTTGASQQVDIILGGTVSIDVDWGDTNSDDYTTSGTKSHTYASADTYTATITGSTGTLSFETANNAARLTAVLTPMSSISGLTSVRECFKNCTSLASIPNEMFKDMTGITTFREVFSGCTGLSGAMPAGIFSGCSGATDFLQSFRNVDFTNIASDTFEGCTSMQGINSTFSSDGADATMAGAIPSGLFDASTGITSFALAFKNRSGLTSIPSDLFDKQTGILSFGECFRGCAGITTYPSGLMTSQSSATTLVRMFNGCTGMSGSIGSGEYDNLDGTTTDVSIMFSGCGSLTGNSYDFWNWSTPPTSTSSCYTACTSLTDYASIPAAYGGGGA
jgi:hypothetical protein